VAVGNAFGLAQGIQMEPRSSRSPTLTTGIEVGDLAFRQLQRLGRPLPVPDMQFWEDNMHLPNHLIRVRRR